MKFCEPKCPTLPVVRKCCFCVPIRKGVTIFGYVNLVLSLLSFPLLVFLLAEEVTDGKPMDDHRELHPLIHLPIAIGSAVVDVTMTIVLLVGTHQPVAFTLSPVRKRWIRELQVRSVWRSLREVHIYQSAE